MRSGGFAIARDKTFARPWETRPVSSVAKGPSVLSTEHSLSRSSERRRKAREVVAELLRHVVQGEPIADEQIREQHPELMPELTEEWQKAQRIHSAFQQADDQKYSAAMMRLQADCSGDLLKDDDPASRETDVDLVLPDRIGRYEIEKLIGQGGFGRVYLAWDDELGRHVAIKTPHPHRLSDPESIATYLSEARVLARLDHPGIVPVYDASRTADGGCYLVSKWIQGIDLATRLQQSRLSPEEAVRVAIETAGALHYAHAHGIVHRDIKPANILLDRQERSCLADFGLAARDTDFLDVHQWAGTPSYMSPEQARGESHRVDGRSDLFSLGVVLYETLTGHRPFAGGSREELLEQIISHDPRPPREWDDRISPELQRICLKLLAKRAVDRYATAKELIVDLRHLVWSDLSSTTPRPFSLAASDVSGMALATGESPQDQNRTPAASASDLAANQSDVDGEITPTRIVPKGLWCFDANDASFFLDLLPGPRDRNGIPESLRQWKTRIEETDSDESFAIGLFYGPSGCGKSSFLRAGLLPLLAAHVESVYVEAALDETESQLLKRLQKRVPDLPVELGLAKCLASIRCGFGLPSGHKVLLVIDQFEQWLSGRSEEERRSLVEALRQCDGSRLQCLLLVRDDFWLAVSRFMAELEIELVQGRNTALVDLFDPRHARKVLIEFGRAYDRLPSRLDQITQSEREFLDRAVAGLTEEGKVIPVRLALFAEMVKSRSWTPETLQSIGGSQGVGVTYLEETFCARTANPCNRAHEAAARSVLDSLLPRPGSPIKGHIRSYPELLDLSGYGDKPRDFKELMRILDAETRLLTPADLIVDGSGNQLAVPPVRYYQLTHDYLVPSLREWLTSKRKGTAAGRAELRLTERSSMWNSTREHRQLPSLWEWLTIRTLIRPKSWSEGQRKMMRVAARRNAVWCAGWLAGILALLLVGAELTNSAKSLLLHIRAGTAPVWLAFGQEDAIFPLLKAESDPTVRTRLIHDLSPLLITSERLITRATEPIDPSVRRALLLGAGEMVGDPLSKDAVGGIQRRSLSETLLNQLTDLYQNDPDPGIHGAAEWALRRYQSEADWKRSEMQLKNIAPVSDRQWYMTREGHTLVVIPGPVRYRMGEEGSQHEELIRRSFSIASKEITIAQFQRFLSANPAARATITMASEKSSADCPALCISWYHAAAYCNWLSELDGIPREQWCFLPDSGGQYVSGMSLAPNWLHLSGYRLPTEAEWEYACRAGSETAWYFGNDSSALHHYAHCALTARNEPSIVGMLKPNEFGLFDMLGNASEWCLDAMPADRRGYMSIASQTLATNVQDRELRVVRGGSITDDPSDVSSAARAELLPAHPALTVGFRVARSYP
jgi:serine/threonine protein kinase/formylglycine-generating enzyme required for sulfatase activity